MNSWQQEINDFNKSLEESSNLGADSHYLEDRELVKSVIAENLQVNDTKEEFLKGFGKDLEKRFPNGGWRTINGSKVFINGGKVVAGLDGFNKEIDKFFDGKKKEGGSKTNKGDVGKQKQKVADLESKLLEEKEKENKKFADRGFGYAQRHSKLGNAYSKRGETLREKLKEEKEKLDGMLGNKPKEMTKEEFETKYGKLDKQNNKQESKKEREFKSGVDVRVTPYRKISDTNKDTVHDAIMDNKPLPKGYNAKVLDVYRNSTLGRNDSIVKVTPPNGDSYTLSIADHDNNMKVGDYETKTADKQKKSESKKDYAFSVTVDGKKYYAEKTKGQNKYRAFDENGNRLNEGLHSSKADFEELVKDGVKQNKRDSALDKKETRQKAKDKSKPTPTIKTFEDLAKKTKSPEDFINKIREIKNVPPQVSGEFFSKYNPSGNLTPQQAASKMWYNANPKDIL